MVHDPWTLDLFVGSTEVVRCPAPTQYQRRPVRERAREGAVKLALQPISFAEAKEFIATHHRHHLPPQGWKFGIAVNDGEKVVGVVTVGRPVARRLDDGWTLEVTRCCTDGTKNAPSMLYGAACRACFALGYRRLITYTLAAEKGTSLIAANWKLLGAAGGGNWSCPSRPRVPKAPTEQKSLWEACP